METSLFKHIHKGMFILSTSCDVCGIKNKGVWAKEAAQKKNTLKYIYRFVTSYLLSVMVTHENEKKQKQQIIHV